MSPVVLLDILIDVVHNAILRIDANAMAACPFVKAGCASQGWAHRVSVEALAMARSDDDTTLMPMIASARAADGTSRASR